MATLQRITNGLPPRDQLALRLLGYAVQAGAIGDDPRETVRRCYALSDAYLDMARDSWREAHGKANADDAETNDNDDAKDQQEAA